MATSTVGSVTGTLPAVGEENGENGEAIDDAAPILRDAFSLKQGHDGNQRQGSGSDARVVAATNAIPSTAANTPLSVYNATVTPRTPTPERDLAVDPGQGGRCASDLPLTCL
jgi:hypothetical protein